MLVVDGGVETELLGDPCAFVVATGDANDAATVKLSNLSDDDAGGANGGGDDKRLTFFWRCDFHSEKGSYSSLLMPSTPRKTVSETKGISGTFWKEGLADSSTMT